MRPPLTMFQQERLIENYDKFLEIFETIGISDRVLIRIIDSTDIKKALKDEAPHLLLTKSEKLV
jgi:2-hydroxychromene-2-carboxylate isomerase